MNNNSLNDEILSSNENSEITQIEKKKTDRAKKIKRIYWSVFAFLLISIFCIDCAAMYDTVVFTSCFSYNTGMYPTLGDNIQDKEGNKIDVTQIKTFSEGDVITWSIMDPNFKEEQVKRFDVVYCGSDSTGVIRRVIGLPTEKIEYKSGVLYINGNVLDEPYLSDEMKEYTDDVSFTCGESSYFLAYDNRTVKGDSRTSGPYKFNAITGRVVKVAGTCTVAGIGSCIKRHIGWPKFL